MLTETAVQELSEQAGVSVQAVKYYFCTFCRHYHATTRKGAARYQDHLPLRDTAIGVRLTAIVKGGRI